MEDNNLMFNNSLWKVNSKITKQTLNRTQQQEGQQLRVIQQPVPNQQQNQQQPQCKQQKDVKEDEEKKKENTRGRWTHDQCKCIVNLWREKQSMLNSSRCNQAWSSIKIEVD